MDEAQELARLLLTKTNIDTLTLKQGIVASVGSTGTLGVYLSAEQTFAVTGIHYLKSYVPRVGDAVWCVKNGPDLIVLGTLANGTELKDVQLKANGGILVGTTPPAGTQLQMITGNFTGTLATFAGAIFLTITIAGGGFPNGIVSMHATCTYPPNAGTGPHSISNATLTAFNVLVPGGTVSGAAAFSYTAIGW